MGLTGPLLLPLVVQEECAEKQVYTRRLEAKLEELQAAADLANKYQAAKQKVCSESPSTTQRKITYRAGWYVLTLLHA